MQKLQNLFIQRRAQRKILSLHFPKTGATFAYSLLKKPYQKNTNVFTVEHIASSSLSYPEFQMHQVTSRHKTFLYQRRIMLITTDPMLNSGPTQSLYGQGISVVTWFRSSSSSNHIFRLIKVLTNHDLNISHSIKEFVNKESVNHSNPDIPFVTILEKLGFPERPDLT